MRYSRIFTLALLLCCSQCLSQDLNKRFSLEIGGGLAIPVFSYSNKDAVPAALYFPVTDQNTLIAYSKEKSGFAESGYNLDLGMTYNLSSHWAILIKGGGIHHLINAGTMEDHISTRNFDMSVSVDHTDVSLGYLMPGIRYTLAFKRIEIGAKAFMGWSICNYPQYKATIHWNTLDTYWEHRGETPNLHSFSGGLGFSFRYAILDRLYCGIDLDYYQAGFRYTIMNEYYPGSSFVGIEMEDKLFVKAVLSGIKFGFIF